MNFLHLSFLLDKMDILNNDVDNYFKHFKVFVVNSDSNELKIQNKLNNDSNKESIFKEFSDKTGSELEENTYKYFMEKEYNKGFNDKYNDKISELYKEADNNSKGIFVPKDVKLSFFARLFGKKKDTFELPKGIHNASIFNDLILSKLDGENEYVTELLTLNKFIIFDSSKYSELKELFSSDKLLTKYIEIKEYTKSSPFLELDSLSKTKEIRSRFKNITELLENIE